MKPCRVLFVCLGNICRSPTAQGVFEHIVAREKLSDQVVVDSAGTSGWHIDSAPDARTVQAAESRGYDLRALRGRKAIKQDFELFDFILAMDQENLDALNDLKPNNYSGHLGLFLDFASKASTREVPDPYYGGAQGFDTVLDLIEDASEGLMAHIKIQR
ncbi:MAG: low molecular weight phosphotyrosine protein phosphatase [Agarilytica sp.]